MLSSGWLLPSGDSLDGAAEDISSAVGISAAKAENGMAPQADHDGQNKSKRSFQSFLHNIILSMIFRIILANMGIITQHHPS